MNEQPLISVIVPVYNVEKYLPKCIQSILEQSYTNLEIILVDDGSSDNSLKICNEFACKDNRIKVFSKENGGQSTARNFGLSIASGKYIGFIDSDDYVDANMYQALYESLYRNDCDIATCARYNVFEDGTKQSLFDLDNEIVMTSKQAIAKMMVYDSLDGAAWDKLFKVELFDGLEFPSGYVCEDVNIVFNLINKSEKIAHCGKPYYYYYQRKGSTMHSKFSEKTKGLEIHHRNIAQAVKEKYPDLTCQANYFYYSRLPILYRFMMDDNINSDYRKEITKKMIFGLKSVAFNKYFDFRQKIKFFLMAVGIFPLIKRGKK